MTDDVLLSADEDCSKAGTQPSIRGDRAGRDAEDLGDLRMCQRRELRQHQRAPQVGRQGFESLSHALILRGPKQLLLGRRTRRCQLPWLRRRRRREGQEFSSCGSLRLLLLALYYARGRGPESFTVEETDLCVGGLGDMVRVSWQLKGIINSATCVEIFVDNLAAVPGAEAVELPRCGIVAGQSLFRLSEVLGDQDVPSSADVIGRLVDTADDDPEAEPLDTEVVTITPSIYAPFEPGNVDVDDPGDNGRSDK